MEENPGVDIEAFKAEEERLRAEYEKAVTQKKAVSSQKPPKSKGVVTRANKSKSKAKSQIDVDSLFKGKIKGDESVKPFTPNMDFQKIRFDEHEIYGDEVLISRTARKSKSTSDNAHVDRNRF